jgi:guanylate kinase
MVDVIPTEGDGGTLYIVSAPSGAGKSSLVNALVEQVPGIEISISHTTRPQRPGEQNGRHYHFVDVQRFEAMLADNTFLEHAQVFGNYYGTSRDWALERLEQGGDVLLEIDWQGARQVRQKLTAHCVSIFILPPSREELEKRLRNRQQDDDRAIALRMQDAVNEMNHYGEYNYIVLNDDFSQALAQISAIVTARRLRRAPQVRRLAPLLSDLLS